MKKMQWQTWLAMWSLGLVLTGSVSAFTLTGPVWPVIPQPMGENWRICPTSMPSDSVQRTIDGALAWNYERFEFTFGSHACLSGGTYPEFNDVNQVDFSGGLGPGVLAETIVFYQPETNRILECDMRFNNTVNWYTGTGTPTSS